ncbi:glycosyltransferase [Baekduia alba]|uniref:hypothetical protein n=1 Tax=Baekduia alba TaxID=2997333 RepID=UPI0023403211|nr:hypothetical protein [Baekduia alba]WCB95748.1 glycosyltransferase [Baekduia alba]
MRALRLTETLRALQAQHPQLWVTTIGVPLALRERYRHASFIAFDQLPAATVNFDIGIAPLLDTPFNRARSNIKVKEYAASRVAWLASPVGPYATLGEHAGSQLVADDAWPEALDALIRDAERRQVLARTAYTWSRSQTIDAAVDEYQSVFAAAIKRAGNPALTSV